MSNWSNVASFATAGGTLVLAFATFGSIRSASRAAKAAELSLLAGLRPLLASSRLEDPMEKIHFADGKWVDVVGGGGVAEVTDDAIYFAIALRNLGNGIGVLHGWRLFVGQLGDDEISRDPGDFRRLRRDIYIPGGYLGFWQGAFREPSSAEFIEAKASIEAREPLTIDVLYGDLEGGQRMVTRFLMLPVDGDGWSAEASRHTSLDRDEPR